MDLNEGKDKIDFNWCSYSWGEGKSTEICRLQLIADFETSEGGEWLKMNWNNYRGGNMFHRG